MNLKVFFSKQTVRSLVVFLSFVFSLDAHAQIVNVESKRMVTDTVGWTGSLGGNMSLTQNVSSVFSANAFATVQWKTKHNLYLFLGDYTFLRGADKNFIDQAFLHVRFNHKITPVTRLEAFTQFQNNKVTKINQRFLWGLGLRFKLNATAENMKMFLGVAAMYEYEEEATEPVNYHRYFRNSSYFSFTWKPNEIVTLVSTSFLQPRLDKPSDFRVLNQESLSMAITKKLSVTVSWDFLYDTTPAEGVPGMNYTLKTGILYQFNPS